MLVLSFSEFDTQTECRIENDSITHFHANTAANESLYSRLHHHAQVDDYLKSKFET